MKTTDIIVDALGWMLLHSVWQIALAGLILSVLLTRLRTTEQRYTAAFATLMTVLLAGIATLGWYAFRAQESIFHQTLTLDQQTFVATIKILPSATTDNAWWNTITILMEEHRTYLLIAWFTGFAFLLLRMTGGLWLLGRLRNTAVPLPGQFQYLHELAAGMNLNHSIAILQSAWINSPVTFGWLKPVILMPVALVNQLPPEEIEALILHELAHIARRDWLMQFVQTLVEAIFYFHPVIWWISSVVRHEREQCSDAKAISLMPDNRLAYARALLRVQEHALAARTVPTLALAADGHHRRTWFKKRAPLLDRVQIILLQSTQQKKSMLMERMLISALLLATCTFWGLKAAPKLPEITEAATAFIGGFGPFQTTPTDTLPPAKAKSTERISKDDGKQQVELELKDGKVSRLEIDGKVIPPAEYTQHQRLVDELRNLPAPPPPPPPPAARFGRDGSEFPAPPAPPAPPARGGNYSASPAPPAPPAAPSWGGERYSFPVPPPPAAFAPGEGSFVYVTPESQTVVVNRTDGNKTVLTLKGDNAAEVVIENGKVFINGQELKEGQEHLLAKAFPEMNTEEWRQYEADMRQYEADMRQHDAEMRQHETDMRQHEKEMKGQEKEMRKHEKEMRKHAQEMEAHAREIEREYSNAVYMAPLTNDFSRVCLSELRADGLVSDPDKYSCSISLKKMKVNGKKQPDNVHKKYLDLFRTCTGRPMGPKDNYSFSVNN